MRPTLYVIVALACAAAGYAVAHAQLDTTHGNTSTVPTAHQSAEIPDTSPFVGRAVKVYFRGSDDLPLPEMASSSAGQVSLAMKVKYFSGVVKQVQAGWIELTTSDPKEWGNFWIPTQSVSFIVEDVPAPATRP